MWLKRLYDITEKKKNNLQRYKIKQMEAIKH